MTVVEVLDGLLSPMAMSRPMTMVAMWMKKSRQVEAAWCAGWTSSMGETPSCRWGAESLGPTMMQRIVRKKLLVFLSCGDAEFSGTIGGAHLVYFGLHRLEVFGVDGMVSEAGDFGLSGSAGEVRVDRGENILV